jgi:hypothetical protein
MKGGQPARYRTDGCYFKGGANSLHLPASLISCPLLRRAPRQGPRRA